MKLDEEGVNEHGVQMCECSGKRVHAWEPGEWCGNLVLPAEAAFAQSSTGKQSPAEPSGDEIREAEGRGYVKGLHEASVLASPAEPLGEVVAATADFLGAWSYCPVSQAPDPSRPCLEDAAKQLLAAITPLLPGPSYALEGLGEARQYLEKIRDLDEQTSDGSLGSLAREKLRAALDSLPVEEERRIEFRVVADFDDDGHTITIAPPDLLRSREIALLEASRYREDSAYKNVRAQVSETRRSPWTDLPSEEGER